MRWQQQTFSISVTPGIDCILCSVGMDLSGLMCPQFGRNFGCFVVAGCCIIYIIEVR